MLKKKRTKKTEKPRRLTPLVPTIKELFAISMNRCAFPGCTHPIIDVHGTLIGEICHIEAAKPDGERFNKKMSNEERRSKENLILLCGTHHTITNNVTIYTVKKMRGMKKNHESKANLAITKLGNHFKDVVDLATIESGKPPQTLKAFAEFMGEDDVQEIQKMRMVYIQLHKHIMATPEHIRKLLALILRKMTEDQSSNQDWYQVKDTILRNDCGGINFREFMDRMNYLRNKNFVDLDEDDETGAKWTLRGYANDNYFHWLVSFCIEEKVSFESLITDGDFTLLD